MKNKKSFYLYLTAAVVLVFIVAAAFLIDRSELSERSERTESLTEQPMGEPKTETVRPEENTAQESGAETENNAEADDVSANLPEAEPLSEPSGESDVSREEAAKPEKSDKSDKSDKPEVSGLPEVKPSADVPETLPVSESTSGVPGAESAPDETPNVSAETPSGAGVVPGVPEEVLHATLSVTCAVLVGNTALDPEKAALVPDDGVIFPAASVEFYPGESVFNLLSREMRKNGIHMEFKSSAAYRTSYIEGIGNLYEFDAGELSGWMYRVNGSFPNKGCSSYLLSDGDTVEWVYTCDLGKDVGAEQTAAEAQKNDD